MRATHQAFAMLALLAPVFASPARAGDFEFFTDCQLFDERFMAVDVSAVKSGNDGSPGILDIIVDNVYIEARSSSGRFWIQLAQPASARLEFDLCDALDQKRIRARDLDAIRILVIGDVLDSEETMRIESRCGMFSPPICEATD